MNQNCLSPLVPVVKWLFPLVLLIFPAFMVFHVSSSTSSPTISIKRWKPLTSQSRETQKNFTFPHSLALSSGGLGQSKQACSSCGYVQNVILIRFNKYYNNLHCRFIIIWLHKYNPRRYYNVTTCHDILSMILDKQSIKSTSQRSQFVYVWSYW